MNQSQTSVPKITNQSQVVVRTRGSTEHYFLANSFVENDAVMIVRKKQHGRESNTIHIASRLSRQDRLLTIF